MPIIIGLIALFILSIISYSIINLIYPLGYFKITSRLRALGLLIACLIAAHFLSGITNEGGNKTSQKAAISEKENIFQMEQANADKSVNKLNKPISLSKKIKRKFSPLKYTPKSNPRTFKEWGEEQVNIINKLRSDAAKIVSQSNECDNVDLSELSDNRSVIKKKIVIFIDCENGKRFYMSDKQINEKSAVKTEQDFTKSINVEDAKIACRNAIKLQLLNPKSYDEPFFGFGASVANKSLYGDRMTITIDFVAKSALGLENKKRGFCFIDSRGLHTVEINN